MQRQYFKFTTKDTTRNQKEITFTLDESGQFFKSDISVKKTKLHNILTLFKSNKYQLGFFPEKCQIKLDTNGNIIFPFESFRNFDACMKKNPEVAAIFCYQTTVVEHCLIPSSVVIHNAMKNTEAESAKLKNEPCVAEIEAFDLKCDDLLIHFKFDPVNNGYMSNQIGDQGQTYVFKRALERHLSSISFRQYNKNYLFISLEDTTSIPEIIKDFKLKNVSFEITKKRQKELTPEEIQEIEKILKEHMASSIQSETTETPQNVPQPSTTQPVVSPPISPHTAQPELTLLPNSDLWNNKYTVYGTKPTETRLLEKTANAEKKESQTDGSRKRMIEKQGETPKRFKF